VPGDISVTGFDDIAIGRPIVPALTTATSPRAELGRRAWSLLHDAIHGREPTENAVLLPGALPKRQSTGPAPGRPGRV
jgi:DNA-binding LacI/PurR family transcriptional regulator